jgi:hypothetical protein
MPDGEVRTTDDVADLNIQSVARSGVILRLVGTMLVVAGAVGVIAWLWLEVRTQQRITSGPLSFNAANGTATGLDLADRIDAFTDSISSLLLSTLVVGVGVASRLVADYAIARSGGSLTGFNAGDTVTDHELTADDPISSASDGRGQGNAAEVVGDP